MKRFTKIFAVLCTLCVCGTAAIALPTPMPITIGVAGEFWSSSTADDITITTHAMVAGYLSGTLNSATVYGMPGYILTLDSSDLLVTYGLRHELGPDGETIMHFTGDQVGVGNWFEYAQTQYFEYGCSDAIGGFNWPGGPVSLNLDRVNTHFPLLGPFLAGTDTWTLAYGYEEENGHGYLTGGIPEPGTVAMVLCGLLGIAGAAVRKVRR